MISTPHGRLHAFTQTPFKNTNNNQNHSYLYFLQKICVTTKAATHKVSSFFQAVCSWQTVLGVQRKSNPWRIIDPIDSQEVNYKRKSFLFACKRKMSVCCPVPLRTSTELHRAAKHSTISSHQIVMYFYEQQNLHFFTSLHRTHCQHRARHCPS